MKHYPANTSPPTLSACSVSAYLGFDVTALSSRSWYSLLHPQDLSHASAQHRSLCKCTLHTYLPVTTKHAHTLTHFWRAVAHPHTEKHYDD